MTGILRAIQRKRSSLGRYRKIFSNWVVAALARYCGRFLGRERLIRLRDGRSFFMRPASDYIALGELFVVETYGACRGDEGARTVWDVGGNIGLFVIWAADFLPNAQFVSFEPCAPTFDLLRRNRTRNPRIHWQLRPYGLSSRTEVCEGHVHRGMYGSASRYQSEGTAVSMPMRNVADVWAEMGSPHIDLIKIDCEGGEYDIIDAMPDAMLRSIQTILMEVHPVQGKDPTLLAKRLASVGFSMNQEPSYSTILVARRIPLGYTDRNPC